MSEETKEKEQPEVKVFKGRRRKERKSGAKKVDLAKSSELFNEEFYVYWPNPSLDLSEYETDDGDIDIDSIPEDCLLEFACRYIDPGTFQEICRTPLSYDIPKDTKLKQEEIQQIVRDAVENQLTNQKTEDQIRAEVIQSCVIDPQFESSEQVRKILPVSLQNELYVEITKGAIGENIVARFPKSN